MSDAQFGITLTVCGLWVLALVAVLGFDIGPALRRIAVALEKRNDR